MYRKVTTRSDSELGVRGGRGPIFLDKIYKQLIIKQLNKINHEHYRIQACY